MRIYLLFNLITFCLTSLGLGSDGLDKIKNAKFIILCDLAYEKGGANGADVQNMYLHPVGGIFKVDHTSPQIKSLLSASYTRGLNKPFNGILGYQVLLDKNGKPIVIITVHPNNNLSIDFCKELKGKYYFDDTEPFEGASGVYTKWFEGVIKEKWGHGWEQRLKHFKKRGVKKN